MNPFLDTPQIEELDSFQNWDDEQSKFEVEDYYDDLSVGIDFSNPNDFWKMFDVLFECDFIQWDEDGVPIPLIEFVHESDESDNF